MESGLKRTAILLAAAFAIVWTGGILAKDGGPAGDGLRRYIIEFRDSPLAGFSGGLPPNASLLSNEGRLEATSPAITGSRKLNVRSPTSRAYLEYLDRTHEAFLLDAAALLGRPLNPTRTYRNAMNGMAVDLTPGEAAELQQSPFVASISQNRRHHLDTDAGPEWIGAAKVWTGQSGFAGNKGEGVVIGIIDSGINWDHPSFKDPANDGYNHTNPFGSQLGLCSDPDVKCNDKIVGVYDFVEDDPGTADMVEENTKGKDNSGHGSHVAGIAAGNTLNVVLNGSINTTLSGVAPHANIVVYRACYIGEPPDPDGGGCDGDAILAAIDQAVEDEVDVINYSIGSEASNPWFPGSIEMAFLNARTADIFVSTSAGNAGPNASSIGSPANAPWVVAVGNATHNRLFASKVQNLSGGATLPPTSFVGAGTGEGIGVRKIVHAKDYGYALCGTGDAELHSSCKANLGLSNPWKGSQPFNGEIVVCDRGIYGRVEKGKNVMLAGAGGYILANTDEYSESVDALDSHCLPATHLGNSEGDKLRTWLSSGSNHMGSISGFTSLVEADKFGDLVNRSSSRGPILYPVEDTLKPNLIAPGKDILSASDVDEEFLVLEGTSMSSPHVTGAAALIRSVHPDWNAAQVASSLETTATTALAKDVDGSAATPHDRGAGRPQLGEAVNAGLYLNVTGPQFTGANPSQGGNPKNLNLSALVDADCFQSCSFTRTVTDQMGGGNWTAQAQDFPSGTQVSISPSSFLLANGASRALTITVNVAGTGVIGEWIYGDIVLSAAGSPDQVLTTAVFSDGGELPEEWMLTDKRDAGWAELDLSGLAGMPDATFTSGGFVEPTTTVKKLLEDPTDDDPFDGGTGVITVWHNLPNGGLWLHAQTLASTAIDVDLYVGRDDSGDGIADEDEQLCSSTTPSDLELCDLFDLPPGNYWVVAQNWNSALTGGDDVTLVSGAVDASDQSPLVATGPGMLGIGESFTLRASWSDLNSVSGTQLLGAIGIGTNRTTPNNIGIIPVRLTRNGYEHATLPLMNGRTQKVGLAGNSAHDRMFVDIPVDVTTLNISAQGQTSSQNNALKIELFRQDFSAALGSPPFAQLPGGLAAVAAATGGGGNGPAVSVGGGVTPGRYFVKLSNTGGAGVAASVTTTVTSTASSLDPQRGLWDFDRNIAQGAEWNRSGSNDFTVWYAYDDDGQPTWYIASGPVVTGNIWTADLLRVTNDGGSQQENKVGSVSVTFIADNQLIYSYTVLGESGFDPMEPNGPNTCPMINGGPKSYTGHWYRGVSGLGGSTVLVYANAQAQVHYLFDARGEPRWILAADDSNQSATAEVIPLLQFSGFCAVCSPAAITYDTVGSVDRTFSSQTQGSWTLTFDLDSPLMQNINRSDSIVKLSDGLTCP